MEGYFWYLSIKLDFKIERRCWQAVLVLGLSRWRELTFKVILFARCTPTVEEIEKCERVGATLF